MDIVCWAPLWPGCTGRGDASEGGSAVGFLWGSGQAGNAGASGLHLSSPRWATVGFLWALALVRARGGFCVGNPTVGCSGERLLGDGKY